MFSVFFFAFAGEADLSFCVCADLYFLHLLSLRQEFGKRILRCAAFLLETVCFDCKEVVFFHCEEDTLW